MVTSCAVQVTPLEKEVRVEDVSKTEAKRKLTREVLIELGFAQKYDQYFWNSVDIAVSKGSNSRFMTWLQQAIAREAGWQHVESQYIARLETEFTEAELKELLQLAKQPLMKKFLKAEVQAFADTAQKRRSLLDRFWENYNLGKIKIPSDVQ